VRFNKNGQNALHKILLKGVLTKLIKICMLKCNQNVHVKMYTRTSKIRELEIVFGMKRRSTR